MSLLSFQLFGHCSDSGGITDESDSDSLNVEIVGVNEATGFLLLKSGLKGCVGIIDTGGNARGSDLLDSDCHDSFSSLDDGNLCELDTFSTDIEVYDAGFDTFDCDSSMFIDDEW